MTLHFARFAAAVLVAAPLALSAQKVEYAAGITKYRLSTTNKLNQTTPAGSMNLEVGVQEHLTVNIARTSKDTMTATVTLDSIALKSAGPLPDLSKLKGASFTSLLSPTGRLYSTKGPEGLDPALAQITDGIAKFLPVYRATLIPGSTWTDTTAGKVSQSGLDVDRTAISRYTVAGDTTIDGVKALRIQRETSIKAAGAGSLQGTPVTMESDGTSTGAFYLTEKGVYLGSNSNDQLNVKIVVLAQNMEISIKQNGLTKVEAIR